MSLADETIPGSASGCTSIGVTTTPIQLVGYNAKRVALIISAPTGGNVSISTNPSVEIGEGLQLYANSSPIWMNSQAFGDFCQRALFAVSSAGTLNIGVVEVSLV